MAFAYIIGLLFQFHKGAIGVDIVGKIYSYVLRFQFHKGAIGVYTLPY